MDDMYVEVHHDVAHVVQEVARLWPDLKVQYCPDPDPGDAPYRIVELCRDNVWRPVLSVWALDNRVLDMLHNCDSYRVDVLAQMDKHNAGIRKAQKEAEDSWRAAARDVLAHAFKSPKTSYSLPDPRPGHDGEIIKISDDPAHRLIVPE